MTSSMPSMLSLWPSPTPVSYTHLSLDTGGLQSGMGKVASVAQQALGVFTGQMMTRAVDALANLGKSALDSVGQLEQNVGGVETLFGLSLIHI